MSRRLTALALLPLAVLGPAGCGTASVPAGDVAKAAADVLEKQVGTRPDISCPRGLEAKVGASTRCTLTAEGLAGTYGVTVTVRSVEGSKARFDVAVDDRPQG